VCWYTRLAGDGVLEPLLDSPRQVFLPSQLDVRVVVGHVDAAMACDLAGLDGTGSYFLPPGDVRASERVQAEAFEVAPGCNRRNFQRLPHARVPQRPLWVLILWKEPLLGMIDTFLGEPFLMELNWGFSWQRVASGVESAPLSRLLSGLGHCREECSRRFEGSAIRLIGVLLLLLSRLGDSILDCASQLFLPLELHHRVIAGLVHRRVARDFARFDGAPALLLPHRDVGPPERM